MHSSRFNFCLGSENGLFDLREETTIPFALSFASIEKPHISNPCSFHLTVLAAKSLEQRVHRLLSSSKMRRPESSESGVTYLCFVWEGREMALGVRTIR